ncbi:MAG: type II secretion system minor pseudopilin GspK [Porticoccaceae bacterium]|nr:type II secretion system minor pseudopilin GspK [Porticoccaceae bacterium]
MNWNQRGIALISVLFVVVVITLLLSQLLTQRWSDIEHTRWLVEDAQAYQYALGGEQLARQILYDDQQNLKAQGLFISPLPRPISMYEPDHGEIRLKITDLKGLINLNSINSGGETLINRFMTEFLQQPQGTSILGDWIDNDNLPRPGGAEDSDYLSSQPSYRNANRNLTDSSELHALEGMNSDLLNQTEHWLVALDNSPTININTMPSQLVTLIHPTISASEFEIARNSFPSGFGSVATFMTSELMAGLTFDASLLTTTSSFFSASVSASAGKTVVNLSSRFRIDGATGKIILLDRNFLIQPTLKRQLLNQNLASSDLHSHQVNDHDVNPTF